MAVIVAAAVSAAALMIVIERGGLIAWTALLLGVGLFLKTLLKPSKLDTGMGIGLALIALAAWFGTHRYVISTWESGEVVELTIGTDTGAHTARLWVLDIGEHPTVYFDAEPELAASLLEGVPVQFTRNGETSRRTPRATRADDLSQETANAVFAAMVEKYGDRNGAADIYYLLLGSSRDRVPVVVELLR